MERIWSMGLVKDMGVHTISFCKKMKLVRIIHDICVCMVLCKYVPRVL